MKNRLRTIEAVRLKILKKLRTASLNSEFTGSYKKKCNQFRPIAAPGQS